MYRFVMRQIKELGAMVEELKKGITLEPTRKWNQEESGESQLLPIPLHNPVQSNIPQTDIASQCAMRIAYKNLIRKKRAMALVSRKDIDTPEGDTSSRIAQEVGNNSLHPLSIFMCYQVTRIATIEGDNQVVRIVSDCLPHIVPGVLLNKREVCQRTTLVHSPYLHFAGADPNNSGSYIPTSVDN